MKRRKGAGTLPGLRARLVSTLWWAVRVLSVRLPLLAAVVFLNTGFAQPADPLRDLAARNGELSTRIADASSDLDRRLAEFAGLRKERHDLDERMQWIERRATVHALGQEFVRTLTQYLHELPAPERFAAASERRAQMLAEASDAELGIERALADLEDLDAATDKWLAALPPPAAPAAAESPRAAVRAALAEQRDLLERLSALQGERLEALRQSDAAAAELRLKSDEARQELTKFLFWTPAVPSLRAIAEFSPSLAWMTSPAHWRAAGEVMQQDLASRPFWPAVALLVATALLLLRGRLQRALAALAPAVVTADRYRIGHAVAALAVTVALSLPVPMLLWTAASVLTTASDGQQFVVSLGYALAGIAKILLALLTIAWLLERQGVTVRHFGWDEASACGAARELRWFMAIFIPLVLVAALNGGEYAPFANRESLGRLAFNLAMLAIAVFCARLFRLGSPLMQGLLARAPRSWLGRFHGAWFAAVIAVPCAVAALAFAGYFVAATYFWVRLVSSVYLAIVAAALYGLVGRWVEIQRCRLARRRDDAESRRPAADAKEVAARLDIAALGERTLSLLDLVVTLTLLGGLWWVWRDAVGALTVVGDYPLWSAEDRVAGKAVTHAVTVSDLLLAILVVAVTAAAVRRVGSFLDVVLLSRFDMQADATYAIIVMTRYAVGIAGILLACKLVGIGWSDVQWLVAALGVGIGFGLQEIVANFVSGLIVLTERPIRIGDVVTVGSISGKVARIHARATVVVDFDSKEVIIPNKAFITEQVVNWTLSNQTTRLLLKVGVAYGSDIGQVQRLILGVLRRHPEVLQEPEPSVFFVTFGDSSLDFEIRAFVPSFDHRLRVQHEINLEIASVLGENGIDIPYPQRDLHIRTAPGLVGGLRADQNGQAR